QPHLPRSSRSSSAGPFDLERSRTLRYCLPPSEALATVSFEITSVKIISLGARAASAAAFRRCAAECHEECAAMGIAVERLKVMVAHRLTVLKSHPIIVAIVCATKGNGASMDGTAARHEADEILAELPDR